MILCFGFSMFIVGGCDLLCAIGTLGFASP